MHVEITPRNREEPKKHRGQKLCKPITRVTLMTLKNSLILVTCSLTFCFSVAGYAQQYNPTVVKAINSLKNKLGTDWIVDLNNSSGLGILIEKKLNRSKKAKSPFKAIKPENIAMAFLKENASFFLLPANMGDLSVREAINEDFSGENRPDYSVTFQQTFNNLPVYDRGMLVRVDQIEGIYAVYSTYFPNINISTTPLISEDNAISIAQEDTLKNHMAIPDHSGGSRPIPIEEQKDPFTERPQMELGIHITEKEKPFLVYRFYLKALGDRLFVNYVINANSGAIIYAKTLEVA
jgi:Zn-dependent metalloprotease